MLVRPCFLIIDHELAGGISTRKLVLESAKFNVITVYSCQEASVTIEAFPNVHALVLNASAAEHCSELLTTVRDRFPEVKRVVVAHGGNPHELADLTVPTFQPDELLHALRRLFPQQTAELQKKEETLEVEAGLEGQT